MSDVSTRDPARIEQAMVADARRKVREHGIDGAVYVSPAEVIALTGWIDRLEAKLKERDGTIAILPLLDVVS